jgi:hypothetical protein
MTQKPMSELAFNFNVCVPDNIRSLKTDLGLNFDCGEAATRQERKIRIGIILRISGSIMQYCSTYKTSNLRK